MKHPIAKDSHHEDDRDVTVEGSSYVGPPQGAGSLQTADRLPLYLTSPQVFRRTTEVNYVLSTTKYNISFACLGFIFKWEKRGNCKIVKKG